MNDPLMRTTSGVGVPEWIRDFLGHASRRPDHLAVRSGAESITYGELAARSHEVAVALHRGGARAGDIVGIAVSRHVGLVVGLLGVVRSGAAYLALDTYQNSRTAAMIVETRTRLVITEQDTEMPNTVHRVHVDRVGRVESTPSTAPASVDESATSDDRTPDIANGLAYVMYTSGSTGQPKGVEVPHTALSNLLNAMRVVMPLDGTDTLAAVSSATFDMSIPELFHPLASGATIALVDDTTRLDPALLANQIEDVSATVLHATPSLWRALLKTTSDAERKVRRLRAFVGAEPLGLELAESLYRTAIEVVNLYGPTEATVWSMAGPVSDIPPTLGKAIANTTVYVLNEDLEPVGDGEVGELYIAGAGLARGYVRRPDLTAARFVANPFGPPGTRMYRTGDRVRREHEGEIVFVGRIDDQVKVRGFRVELNEVDTAILSLPAISEAATVARDDEHGGGLVTFVVPAAGGGPLDVGAIRRALRRLLPEYMLPGAVHPVRQLPRNARGKLDRVALATLRPSRPHTVARDDRTALATIVAETLGVDSVGADDDFFALGGHSLMAAQLVSTIRVRLHRDVRVSQVLRSPTIGSLAAEVERSPKMTPAPKVGEGSYEQPSFAQERLWFLDAQDARGSAFNMPLAWEITGTIDEEALRLAVEDVCYQHQSLRTVIESNEGRPRPRLLKGGATLRVVEVSAEALDDAMNVAARYRFDLAKEPPTRWTLFNSDSTSVLVAVTHHIATDGWSERIIVRDLSRAYAARISGESDEVLAPALRYVDYAHWQRHVLQEGGERQRQLNYWRAQLSGLPQSIQVATDAPRPPVASYAGATHEFTLDRGLLDGVRKLAADHGATPSMVMQTALISLLNRLGAGRDIPLGALSAGRTHQELGNIVGYFGNTWVLRIPVPPGSTFVSVLHAVRAKALEAYDCLDVPFEDVVAEVNPPRSSAHHPLFQIALAYNEARIARPIPDLPDVRATARRVHTDTSRFDMLITCDNLEDGSAVGSIEYATDLYDVVTIRRISKQLLLVLRAAVQQPSTDLRDISLLTDAELLDWRDRSAGPIVEQQKSPSNLVAIVAASALQNPDAIAVTSGSSSRSYAELMDSSAALARALVALGIGRGSRVGLAIGRTPDLVVAMLAVLRAGAAYVPLDPRWASHRLSRILVDARPALVLADQAGRGLPLSESIPVLDPVVIATDQLDGPAVPTTSSILPTDAAYVMYTSGSSGEPKGVIMSHGTIVSDLVGLVRALAPDSIVSTLATSSINFDVSALEIFGTLRDGGTVHLMESLVDVIGQPKWSGTVLSAVPSVLAEIVDDLAASVAPSTIVLAGEPLTRKLLERVRAFWPRARIINSYGQTESFYATTYRVDPAEQDRSTVTAPIGTPLAGTRAYVLDDALQPASLGIVGDLYVGGAIADGYVGRAGETALRFVADPFSADGARMYRTGDRARWTRSGVLEYVERDDAQIKVNGVRIEPAEIIQALERVAGVTAAAVVRHGGSIRAPELVAYVTVQGSRDHGDEAEIRAHLARDLPSNLLPHRIIIIAQFPLLDNGKVDAARLAALALPSAAPSRVAPLSSEEHVVARIFGEVLGTGPIGPRDDFFQLGGHSLRVAVLASRLSKEFDERCSMTDILQHPTPADFTSNVVARWRGAARDGD